MLLRTNNLNTESKRLKCNSPQNNPSKKKNKSHQKNRFHETLKGTTKTGDKEKRLSWGVET